MNRNEQLTQAIIAYEQEAKVKKSKNIAFHSEVNNEILAFLKKKIKFDLGTDEKVLFVLNLKSKLTNIFGATGVVLTDKRLFVAPIKRNFFASMIPLRAPIQSILFEDLKSFQVGEHDACYGTAYVGHDIIINGQAIGMVRMGLDVLLDDKAIEYINGLSSYLHKKGLFDTEPKEYKWQ